MAPQMAAIFSKLKKSSLKLSEPSPFEQHFINSLRPSDAYSRWTIIGSDNGLSPGRRQAIIWSNAELLLNGPLGTNFSEFLIKILTFSLKKMRLKVSSVKWHPFCLSLNVLTHCGLVTPYGNKNLGQYWLR